MLQMNVVTIFVINMENALKSVQVCLILVFGTFVLRKQIQKSVYL